MKKVIHFFSIFAVGLLLFLSHPIYSQVPNNVVQRVSGAWIMTHEETEGPSFIVNEHNCKFGSVIEVKGNELLIETQRVCDGSKKSKDPIVTKTNHLYYLDERGEINDFLKSGKIFSKTKVTASSVIIQFYKKSDVVETLDSKARPLVTHEYTVSKDGKLLTVVIKDSGKGLFNLNPFNITETYQRAK